VNVEGLADYSRISPFVDLMKTSRRWGLPDAPWNEDAPTDANGWPTVDAGTVVKLVQTDEGDTPSFIAPATYKLKFSGVATVGLAASPGITIGAQSYDPATNTGTADVVVGSGAYQLILTFRNTAGGVKNVTLRPPGYADSETFSAEFKQAVAPFGTLRFMDFLSTNNSAVKTWAERTIPASATQATTKGGAYEYAIQMANELGKDIWINIPVNADDDFVRQLASLLNTTFAPGRVVYFEYDNELWNWMFQHSGVNMDMAINEAVAGDTSLTAGVQCTRDQLNAGAPEQCNKWWAALLRVPKRTVAISKIFSEVMGAAAMNTRFRPVLATQFGYRAIGEQQLKYMAKYHGAPKTFVYGVAGAPYFTMTADQIASTTLTVDQILASLQANVDTEFAPSFRTGPYAGGDWTNVTQKALADFYGIKSLAYEGGLDMGQSAANTANKMAAVKDARMGAIAKSALDQWFGCGNDLFLYYSLSSGWGSYGYWGLTNKASSLDTPRYNAAKQVAQSAPATTCR
jgi:hypothetical protein